MGFFDNVRNFINRLSGREPQRPDVSSGIQEAFSAPAPKKKGVFERIKEVFTPKPETESESRNPFESFVRSRQDRRERANRRKKFEALSDERKEAIFRFRRNTEDEGDVFYRLTQAIWDRPGVNVQDRDKAIQDYFRDNYGMGDMNEIYDYVLSANFEAVEEYRNAPNAEKYSVLKNIVIMQI